MIKADALNAYKNMKVNEALAIKRQRQKAEKLIHLIKGRQLFKKMWKSLQKQIREAIVRRRIEFLQQCIKFTMGRKFRKRGKTLDIRLCREIKNQSNICA